MAADTLTLKVVTPDQVFFEGPVQSVIAPGALGYLGILKNHAPFVSTLGKGNLTFRDDQGATKTIKVEPGFLEVLQNRVLVLTDKVEA